MSTDKKRKDSDTTTVTIPKKQHDQIKKIAEKEGKLVRRVVEEIVKKGLEAEAEK